jgi:hypothetical protein
MRPIIVLLSIIIFFLLGVIFGLNTESNNSKKIITQRIHQRWGEGDMGEAINAYILYGDSNGIDRIELKEPNL